jgi:hypothetical protein
MVCWSPAPQINLTPSGERDVFKIFPFVEMHHIRLNRNDLVTICENLQDFLVWELQLA